MPFLLKLLIPVIAGAFAGGIAMVAVVQSQTQPPDQNPASQEILEYGD